jgi:hypothetical protein
MVDHRAVAVEGRLFRSCLRGGVRVAAVAGFEFGREAEDQVVEVTEDLLTIASLGGGPVLVMGLISSIARRRTRQANLTARGGRRSQTVAE